MNKNTVYLLETNNEENQSNQVLEVNIDYKIQHQVSLIKLIRENLLKELTTYEGRMDAIKNLVPFHYNIPIMLNHDVILFKVYDCINMGSSTIWVNGINILSIQKHELGTEISLRGGKIIKTRMSYYVITNYLKKVDTLLNL